MALLLLLIGFADVSVATLAPGAGSEAVCGSARWRELRAAVETYCRDEADESEALGCRVARYSFSHRDAAPGLSADDDGTVRGSIRDPRDRSYAWTMAFARARNGWRLERFAYAYDDCDAIGVPPPPRGKLRLADLRRGPDDRD